MSAAARIAIYLDWPDRYAFFRRLAPALEELRRRPVFCTNKLALARRARRDGLDCRLLARPRQASSADLERTRERIAGSLTRGQAARLHAAAREALAGWSDLEAIWIWNGDGVVGHAARELAAERGLGTLFLEIGNLPGRLFADPRGTNWSSALARDPARLDRLEVSLEAWRRWRRDYLDAKRAGHRVPQAAIFSRVDWRATLVNRLAFALGGVPTDDRNGLAGKALDRRRRRAPVFDPPPAEGSPFLLFPMQVEADAQVLLNSDVGNAEAIRTAAERAAEAGAELVVKPHPAETDPRAVSRLAELRSELGFRVSGGDTFELLGSCRGVVTINSTVGLEALILGRPVEFLGRSLYDGLRDEARLARYVLGYLVDVDYFGADPVPATRVRQLLERTSA